MAFSQQWLSSLCKFPSICFEWSSWKDSSKGRPNITTDNSQTEQAQMLKLVNQHSTFVRRTSVHGIFAQ